MKDLMNIERVDEPAEETWRGRLNGLGHQTFNLDDAGSIPVRATK
jgi:hypothetical protein